MHHVNWALPVLAAFVFGCHGGKNTDHQAVHKESQPMGQKTEEHTDPLRHEPQTSKSADGHLPPIECPLRKAGIDPHNLKPFEEMEKYIAFLEQPERQKWQRPDEVVAALGLQGSEKVVDLGAGSGYFTFRLATALPQGKVIAIDSQPEMVRHIHHRVVEEGISNVEVRLAKPDDPDLPSGVDLVFICDVLHHIPQRSNWLKKLHSEMPRGAKLAVVEFKSGDLPEGPPESVKISKNQMIELLKNAGFLPKEDRPSLLPYQEFIVFEKP